MENTQEHPKSLDAIMKNAVAEQRNKFEADLLRLRSILTEIAARRQTTTYSELAEMLGLPTTGNALGQALSPLLYEILDWCKIHNVPPLTVLVVRKSGADAGLPGQGFWNCLNLLPLLESEETMRTTKRRMTRELTEEVYAYWGMHVGQKAQYHTVGGWTNQEGAGRSLVFVNKTLNQRVRLDHIGVHVFQDTPSDHFAPEDHCMLKIGGPRMVVVGGRSTLSEYYVWCRVYPDGEQQLEIPSHKLVKLWSKEHDRTAAQLDVTKYRKDRYLTSPNHLYRISCDLKEGDTHIQAINLDSNGPVKVPVDYLPTYRLVESF